MVMYYCERCGYNNKIKTKFIGHLNRKFICKPILSEVSIQEIKEQYGIIDNNDTQMTHNDTQMTHHDTQNVYNDTQMTHNNIPNKLMCKDCNQIFSRTSSLTRHIKLYCKENENKKLKNQIIIKENEIIKLENEIILKENKLMKKELRKNNKMIENNMIINGNNNNTNNIIINNFGNENLEYLTPKYLTELTRIPSLAIPKLIKDIHFNDKHPENKNVRLLHPKNRFIEVHENKWEHRNKKEIIEHIVETINDIMENNYNNNRDTMEESIKRSLVNYIKHYNNKKETKDYVNENAELAIINNS